MKTKDNIQELSRIQELIDEAESDDLLFVHPECGDHRNAKPNDVLDPYPLFFHPSELIESVMSGGWHYVQWELYTKKEISKAILNRISELNERLLKINRS